MEKMILSLKNIYKILMTNDFPIYSESVISEKNRKGQTLVRFWQSQLIEEFRCLPCGKMIWRNDGKRNRYISNLCNRSTELKYYSKYAKELASQVSVSSILNQIDKFVEFLSDREYKHDILVRRIQESVRLWKIEDNHVTEDIARQIGESLSDASGLLRYGVRGNLFQAGYLLTLLTVYAAAGEAMDDPVLAVLYEENYSIGALWAAYNGRKEQEKTSITLMTVHAGMLQDNPLPQSRFFGREEELYDLQEMAVTNRKCLISGIGGIGKTEVLRQLIRRVTEENLVDKLAIVPYESGIAESFVRAFPGILRNSPEDSFEQCIRQLNRETEKGSRVLLLIDNMNNGLEDDEQLAQLTSLNCGVLITTRRTGLEGFEVYRLSNLSVTTGTLIFRDNYGHPLMPEDRKRLKELLHDEVICHPLTLRLMAKAAYHKNWSLTQLEEYLQKREVSLTWTEGGREERLDRMYTQLYSLLKIPEECQRLAELFTLLPAGSYSRAFLGEYFPEIITEEDDCSERLQVLTEGGWLDGDDSGYFMHPVIAQCLRRKVITAARVETVLHKIIELLCEVEAADLEQYEQDDVWRISEVLQYAVPFISGSIGSELLQALACGVSLWEYTKQKKDRLKVLLEQMMKRCPEKSEPAVICCQRALCRWNEGDTDSVVALYERQKERMTVSKTLFCDFCLAAGYELKYKKDFETAEKLFTEVLAEDVLPVQKATAYFYLYELGQVSGDFQLSNRYSQLGAEYVKAHPECGEGLMFTNIYAYGANSLTFGRKEPAQWAVNELKGLLNEQSANWRRAQYESLAGVYEKLFGDSEKALIHLEWQRNHILEYQGKGYQYYGMLGQIASVLKNLKRYDEAIESYRESIDYARENGYTSLYQMFSNNLSLVYLELNNPKQALESLSVAVTEGRKLGGIALAEALRNSAAAYGQLGDFEKEYECLAESAPLLLKGYGPENPRTVAAKHRLSELEALKDENGSFTVTDGGTGDGI